MLLPGGDGSGLGIGLLTAAGDAGPVGGLADAAAGSDCSQAAAKIATLAIPKRKPLSCILLHHRIFGKSQDRIGVAGEHYRDLA